MYVLGKITLENKSENHASTKGKRVKLYAFGRTVIQPILSETKFLTFPIVPIYHFLQLTFNIRGFPHNLSTGSFHSLFTLKIDNVNKIN